MTLIPRIIGSMTIWTKVSDIQEVLEGREEDGVEFCDLLRTETFAKGDSGRPGIGMLERRGLGACLSFRRIVLARFVMRRTMDGVDDALFGAREESLEDADEDGRAIGAGAGFAAFVCLLRAGDGTRVGDVVRGDTPLGACFSGVAGVTLIAEVRFTCSALRCGRGLIARPTFSAGFVRSSSKCLPFSSLSSSDMLSLRRVPARAGGEGPRFS